MKHRVIVPVVLALALSLAPSTNARRTPGQTKKQAEVNVLRTLAHEWRKRRLPGIIDPRTHLVRDNTEAVCRGRGRRSGPRRYTRFSCVVRPHVHTRRQGLYLTYRARPRGDFTLRWIVFRSH